ncbi:MAG: DUF547 domain-containing protein [Geminicoccaceae bacterium]|nr:MAG: DUF547 domain-containing protein [Geminicoccaceae bacterium]
MHRRDVLRGIAASAGLATAGFAWIERLAAPPASLIDPHWTRHEAAAAERVDHGRWAGLLERYVVVDPNGPNRVRYAAVDATDRAALAAYLESLEATTVTALARPEQLAFWLNLYNALTIAVVLDHYPVESIRDITFGRRRASGPWREQLVRVEGRRLSLDDIEHGIVRPVFAEPRIHYAVNCAAIGCPDLQPEPFAAARLNAQLDRAATSFVNDPRGVIVTTGGDVTVSSIYNWFQADFGGSEAAVLDHLRAYAAPALRTALDDVTSIRRYAYDWRLNAA